MPPSPLSVALFNKCPRCGRGHLFKGIIAPTKQCERCGLDYSFIDTGDGPAIFVMLFMGFVVLGGALYVEFTFEPQWWVHALIWPPAILAVCLMTLRPLKGLLIALQYKNQARQGRLYSVQNRSDSEGE
jgi:uncharacterized protein (DUF983 family)